MSTEKNLRVIIECVNTHPVCEHGPTLLFERKSGLNVQRFFACSAYRDQKECPIHICADQYKSDEQRISNQLQQNANQSRQLASRQQLLMQKIIKMKLSDRHYCHTCNTFVLPTQINSCHITHDIQDNINDEQIKQPTTFLKSMSNDKREAQYFFSNASLKCFVQILQRLQFNKVICIGAPRLYEYLKYHHSTFGIKCILLDIDTRFNTFFNENASINFYHYNMFNNYFFAGTSAQIEFENFLKLNSNERCCIFTDPPFGCRTEPLVFTLQTLQQQYRYVNKFHDILSIFWIFPYFMEMYITSLMPEMIMIDYKVDYTNHESYHSGKNGRKQGSPVRIFTNVPANYIELPIDERYRFCKKCNRWTSCENRHCDRCKCCPSKNGNTYVHCNLCETCVKPSYKHCNNCWRCTQIDHHDCIKYQLQLNCKICFSKGHTEPNCHKWFASCDKSLKEVTKLKLKSIKTGRRICFICFRERHNEQMCTKRGELLQEKRFLDKHFNILSSDPL